MYQRGYNEGIKEGFKEGFSKLPGAISDFEKKLLNKKNNKKDIEPKKIKTVADLLFKKKGGLVKNKTSKVAGKLAIRGYGKAMKGKK